MTKNLIYPVLTSENLAFFSKVAKPLVKVISFSKAICQPSTGTALGQYRTVPYRTVLSPVRARTGRTVLYWGGYLDRTVLGQYRTVPYRTVPYGTVLGPVLGPYCTGPVLYRTVLY